MLRRMYLIFFAMLIALLIYWASFIDDWSRDLSTNYAELTPSHADPLMRPVEIGLPPAKVADLLNTWTEGMPRWRAGAEDSSEGALTVRLTRTTALMRYVDDVEVTLRPNGTGCIVEASSQSRVGKGDLGQNPRNLRELTQFLRTLDAD